MYRKNEEQMEMLKVSEKMIDEIFDAYNKKELDKQMEMLKVSEKMIDEIFDAYNKKELDNMNFISKCSFVCGFIYATFGDCEKYEVLEASIKILIDTYQYDGGDNHETQ